MFKIGDLVLYGANGVCRICEKRTESFSGKAKEYYILSPEDDPKITIYVPLDAPELLSLMHPLLSKEEAQHILDTVEEQEPLPWVVNPSVRCESFRSILAGDDRTAVIRLIFAIHKQRLRQNLIGKRLYASDALLYEKAQDMIHAEFALVLGMAREEVRDYLLSHLPRSVLEN